MNRLSDPLVRAWAALIVLSAVSTTLALLRPLMAGRAADVAIAAAILTLCWLKARVILGRYLGLETAPQIRRGFDIVVALVLVAIFGLSLAAG